MRVANVGANLEIVNVRGFVGIRALALTLGLLRRCHEGERVTVCV